MARIKIGDIPKDQKISKEELKKVRGGAVFAKYDGFDGESKDANHDKWIDVLSIQWK